MGQNGTTNNTLTVGGGTGSGAVTVPQIKFGDNSASTVGILNLLANGLLNVGPISNPFSSSATINFTGGTLQVSRVEQQLR